MLYAFREKVGKGDSGLAEGAEGVYQVSHFFIMRRISKERIEESEDLIRKHLVTLHDDGDENSLFVRFGELMVEREELEWNVKSLLGGSE